MTRKDYLMLSAALKAARTEDAPHTVGVLAGLDRAACYIADAIEKENAAFDVPRFLADAGVTP